MIMSVSICYLNHSSGTKIPYFTENNTIWLSAVDVARLLNYSKPQGAIKRHVSPWNQKKFSEFSFQIRVPGIQANRIFINFSGLQELLKRHDSHPLALDWSTPKGILNNTDQTDTSQNVGLKFDKLAEIPETFSTALPAQGFVYLLRWENLVKVGKTRSISTRKQGLQQRYKNSEMIWYCTCENIDLLEREILGKLEQMGALVKTEGSLELFDPTLISLDEVKDEIERLARKIDKQYTQEHERIHLKQEYTKLASATLELTRELANEYPKESLELLELVFLGFRDL